MDAEHLPADGHYCGLRQLATMNEGGQEISRVLYAYSTLPPSDDNGAAHTDGGFIGDQQSIIVLHEPGTVGLPVARTRRDGKTEFHRAPENVHEMFLAVSMMRKAPPKPAFIYFVEDPSTGHIKIGVTANLKTRLSSLKTGTSRDFRFLGAVEGPRTLEKELHQRFLSIRVRREWFEPSAELLQYIADHANVPA